MMMVKCLSWFHDKTAVPIWTKIYTDKNLEYNEYFLYDTAGDRLFKYKYHFDPDKFRDQ